MGLNLGSLVTGAVEGGLMGGVPGAVVGGVTGGMTGSAGGGLGTIAGNVSNGELQAAEAMSDQSNVANQIETMGFEDQEQWQNTWFNQMVEQKSQQMQQVNELRDVAMQQRKADDSVTKEYIQSIKE